MSASSRREGSQGAEQISVRNQQRVQDAAAAVLPALVERAEAQKRSVQLNRSLSWWGQASAIFAKDLRAELRNRAAVNAILLFAVTSLVVVGYSLYLDKPSSGVKAALLWVVLFFAAFSGLSHVFTHEEEASTSTALRLTASPGAIYAGKLFFNLTLLAAIAVVAVPLFMLMLDIRPERLAAFVGVLVTGCLGLAAAATIVAAIIAKARGKGALYGALGFPVLLPLLMIAVHGTSVAMLRMAPVGEVNLDIVGLGAFTVMVVTASALLFPVIWED